MFFKFQLPDAQMIVRKSPVGVSRGMTARQALSQMQSRGKAPRRQEGQILILFTLVIVVIMLFASMVVDLGLLRNNRQMLVNALDSAALAGGTKLPVNGCSNKQLPAGTACSGINGTISLAEPNAAHDLIRDTLLASYNRSAFQFPESASGWQMSYRCLIGVDGNNPPQPYIVRDVPVVCNPRHAGSAADAPGADHNPVAAISRVPGRRAQASAFRTSATSATSST